MRVLAFLAALALLPLALAALLLALLQSESGRLWAEAAVDRVVPGVRIDGLGPGLPTRLDLARVELRDDAGTWLAVEGIDVRWRPAALLRGQIVVERVAATRVAVPRPPAGAPAPDEPEPEPAPAEPFSLPERIVPVRVETLTIDRIELGQPVLGETAAFGLEGRLDAGSGTAADLDLRLTRLDIERLEATVDALLELDARRLDLNVALDERSGLVATLTGEPALAPLTVELAGEGPLADWPGQLDIQAGRLARFESTLGLSLDDAPRLSLDGRLIPGPALDATPYAPLLAEGVDLALTAARPGTALVVERLRVEAAALSLAGEAALRDDTATVDLDLSAPRLAALAPLTGTELDGSATVSVALDGPLPLPPGTVRIEGRDLRAGDIRVATLDQELVLSAGDGDAIAFTADGEIAGIAVPAGEATFEEHIALAAAGAVTPGGPFALDRLEVDGRTVALSAEASGDLEGGAVALTAGLRVPELAAFRPISPAAPEGAFALDFAADLADGFSTGTVTLDGGGEAIAGLPPAAQALVGSTPTLLAEARLVEASPALRLETLALDGARFGLTGEASFAPPTGELDATVDLRVPALAPVGEALGQPLGGSLALDLEAGGTLADLDAEAVLTAEDLEASGQRFEQVRAALTATGDPSRLTGELDAAVTKAAGEVTLAGAYTLTGERVDLRDLRLAAPGLGLEGGLDVALAPLAVDGRLAGGSEDLAPLGRWLDLPLAGGLDLELALAPTEGQTARVDVATSGLSAAGIAIDRASLDATATDLFATPRLTAEASLAGLATGETVVESAEVDVGGGLEALSVDFDAAGRLPQSFDLAGAADLALAGGPTTVTLTRLDGTLEELPVRLLQPATLRMEGATLALEGLALQLDTGRLDGAITLGPERLDGGLELDGLRLERLGGLGVPPLAGELGAAVNLDGTRRAPVVAGDVTMGELRPVGGEGPPASLNLDWRLAGGGLSATLASRGFGDPPLTVDAQVPVTFALEPFTFALPQPVPLDVDVDGVVDLARAAGWYGLEDRLVAGRLATDLSIAGSVDAPRFDGEVTLADGRYVDLATGVAIEDLRTRIAAEGRRLVVRELVANDGGDGRIRGDGAIDFAGAVPDFDVEAQMSNFAVLQRETLYVVMSGDASVDGEGGDVAVRGDFTVNQGEIFLEGGDGAAGFASLDVVEQSELDGAEDGTEAITPASVVDLDIGVAIPGRLFVRGRGLVSEWEGALQIFGTAEEPRIEGTIEYRRGYFDLFDRRFDLRRGEIQFTGASPPDPFVTVEATVELPETTAVLRVDGPALDPEVTVTSEPPMPEDEVLAQLLFDRNQSELNAFQALRLAAAVNELRGGGVGVLDRLRSGLGIDTLGVGGESADDATLEAGAYVSEDVFVQVERGLKPGSAGATVEVELTPRLNVQTRVREDSTGSVGLNWSLDY